MELLNKPGVQKDDDQDTPEEKARVLIETLASFRINATVTNIAVGPALTRIEIQPAAGTRISRITALQNDITMALAAPRLRMEAPIPGKNAIGIEIPNKGSTLVVLRDILESKEFKNSASPVTMAFGREASGKIIVADLTRMPHLLIAGATGSGKSVCINDIIVSMVYKSSPQDVRFILVDPKMVEMTMYGSLPHLLIPVVTDPKKAAGAMRWAVKEMTTAISQFAQNAETSTLQRARGTPQEASRHRVSSTSGRLMIIAPDARGQIAASRSRPRAGIHLILATHRPGRDGYHRPDQVENPIPRGVAVVPATTAASSRMAARKSCSATGHALYPRRLGIAHPVCSAPMCGRRGERVVAHFSQSASRPTFDDQILTTFPRRKERGEPRRVGEGSRMTTFSARRSLGFRARTGQHQHDSAEAPRGIRALLAPHRQHGAKGNFGFNGSKAPRFSSKRAQLEELFDTAPPLPTRRRMTRPIP
jgi:S-DNA-T family DNA segregation ATPase FtsK/SpoIIIE